MEKLTAQIRRGQDLQASQVVEAAEDLLSDAVPEGSKVDFLRALAGKGETPAEIAGFVEAFLERAVDPGLRGNAGGEPLLDVCGTGGDKLDLFNVSTASVFLLAAGGVRVAKHGNRGITSRSGGADVLEALGVPIDLSPENFARCVEETGAGFLFAPLYHPAFKVVAPVRKILAQEGKRTLFNLVGPLLNPARPGCQLVGVFSKELVPVFTEILSALGRKTAWVVHGTTADGRGMDELSILGETFIGKTGEGGKVSTSVLDPATLGFGEARLEELRGGDAAENARILTGILEGDVRGAKRDMVLLNAAAGFVIAGVASDLAEGIALGARLIDGGEAMKKLEALRGFAA